MSVGDCQSFKVGGPNLTKAEIDYVFIIFFIIFTIVFDAPVYSPLILLKIILFAYLRGNLFLAAR